MEDHRFFSVFGRISIYITDIWTNDIDYLYEREQTRFAKVVLCIRLIVWKLPEEH